MPDIGSGGGLTPAKEISATIPVSRGNGAVAAALAKLPAGTVITGIVQGRDGQGHTLLDTPQGSLRFQAEPSLARYLLRGTEVLLRLENHGKQVHARLLTIDGKPLARLADPDALETEDVVEESLKPLPNAPARAAPLATYSHLKPGLLPALPSPVTVTANTAAGGAPLPALPPGTPVTVTLPALTPQQAQILLQLIPALGEFSPPPAEGQKVTLQLRVVASQLPANAGGPVPNTGGFPAASVPSPGTGSALLSGVLPPASGAAATPPAVGNVTPAGGQAVTGSAAAPGASAGAVPATWPNSPFPAVLPSAAATGGVNAAPGASPGTGAPPFSGAAVPAAGLPTGNSAPPAVAGTLPPGLAAAAPPLNPSHLPGEPLLLGTLRVVTESTFAQPAPAQTHSSLAAASPLATPSSQAAAYAARPIAVLETALGLLRLPPTLPQLPPGTQLALEIVHAVPLGQGGAAATLMATVGDAVPMAELASRWQSLEEAAHHLQMAGQDQPLRQLLDQLPQGGARLGASTLFFLAALGRGGTEPWLPPQVAAALERIGHGRLGQRIEQEFSGVRQIFTDSAQQPWQVTLLPVLDESQVRPARFYRRRERGQEDGEETSRHERFVIEINLSQFGPMQLDGLYRQSYRAPGTENATAGVTLRKQFALLIRTHLTLPDEVRREVGDIFRTTLEGMGMAGTLGFDVTPHFPEFGANEALKRMWKDVEA